MYVEVKTLAPCVQSALESVGYGARDIAVETATTIEPSTYAGDGQRGFLIAVNLETGERKQLTGSWGGSNMFTESIDDARGSIPIPPNGAFIKGTMGYPRTFATIYTYALGNFLPSGNVDETTDEEQNALYCFQCLKGGAYRQEELSRRHVAPATVDALVERGYLKRSKNGATAITTKGKNAYDRKRAR